MKFILLLLAGVFVIYLLSADFLETLSTQAETDKLHAQAAQTEAEAQRLSAETTRAQATTQLEAQRALVEAQNAHTNDLRGMVIGALLIAAVSVSLAFGVVLWSVAIGRGRQPQPPIVYQVTAAQQPAQIQQPTPFELFHAQRAHRRELLAANERRIL